MFRVTAVCVAIALVLTGCADQSKRGPDATPVHPTAVIERHLISQGGAEFPAFEGTTRTYTRADMQRRDSTFTGTGDYVRFVDAGASTRVSRLDRKLIWTLDANKRQYTECPLTGCRAASPNKPTAKIPGEIDSGAECRLKINGTSLTVERTGRQRTVAGYDSEQYAVVWLVTFRDNAARVVTSTVNIDLWSVPAAPDLREALVLEQKYARKRDALSGAAEQGGRSLSLPVEVGRMLDSYLSRYVSPTDRSTFLAGAKKMDQVDRLPTVIKVTWHLGGKACALDDMLKNADGKPLFTFESELQSARLEALHDSLYAPPKGYERVR